MRILFLTQLFQPEPNHLKGLAFAEALVWRGHEVEVLTGFPNYPGGKIYPGYRIKPWMRETMGGIRVTRVPVYPSHDRSAVGRMACYLSFALAAAKLGPLLVAKPDIVYVYQGPATLGWPAIVFRGLRGAPYILDVQDLWPESVSSTGMLPVPGTAAVLGLWSKMTYGLAERIIVLSEGYRDCLIQRGVPPGKIEVVHNWCDEKAVPDQDTSGDDPLSFRGWFNLVYTGNFGKVQALENILEAAQLTARSLPRIRFIFVGSGVEGPRLRALAAQRNLTNVLFIPRQSPEQLKAITAAADVLLVHLKDDPLARMGIPQKTQAAMAAGKPILMAVAGSAADLVIKAGAGFVCRPESPQEIADCAVRMAELAPEDLKALGLSANNYYKRHLSFSRGVERIEGILDSIVRRRSFA